MKLSVNEFTILRDLIHERIGNFYSDDKRELLEDKLSPVVIESGFDSFLDYYYALKYETTGDEWQKLKEAIRVPETYFWREIDRIQVLVDILVPQYFATGTLKPLRIWSAACSSGEEPLSIAMALNEAGWFQRAKIEIVASDMSVKAIEKAKQGIYTPYSLRNLPDAMRAKYFKQVEERKWQITPELPARISWRIANLMARSDLARLATVNVIFCRNVFIYFSDEHIRKIVNSFYEFMLNPGYLFVGASESLLRITTDFELQDISGAYVYVKKIV